MISPTPRNQQFRRMTVEGADWVSSPGGVYTVPPASTANGISATLTNLLNTAGDPTAMGVLAWRMFDQNGQLVQGGDGNRYLIEMLMYTRVAAGNLSFAAELIGLCPHSTAAKFVAGATACDSAAGINYSAAAARPMTHFRAVSGASTPANTGVAGGYAALEKVYSYTRILRATGYQTRVDDMYESNAGVYKFDDSVNIQGVLLSPQVAPNALRFFLALGSYGGALLGNQPIEVDVYYSATKLYGAVP